MKLFAWTALLVAPLLAGPALPQDILRSIRKDHPRLIALDSDIDRIRELIKTDSSAHDLFERIKGQAAKIEKEPPIEYLKIGPRLLDKSRKCVEREYTLALMFRLTGEKHYRDRAVQELRAAAGFPDWNPSHFLDVAEMTHGFAIGYDWLYPALSEEERGWIRKAIVGKGLELVPPLSGTTMWWRKSPFNWNQVCNGGIGIGALAIASEEPEKAAPVLRASIESIPVALASYAPDGGWAEGPGYWGYATRYTVYFMAALDTALGTDFGLSHAEGFDHAGHFRVYFTGPTGKTFNYADAGENAGEAPEMFWLARRFHQPVYAWHEWQMLANIKTADPLNLIWYTPGQRSPAEEKWPLNAAFKGVRVAFFRSSWEDQDAMFFAVKGGDNKANHSHLDLGSFVMDALGIRWATDFGSDDYNLPNYFGKDRWTYYRLISTSHNIVILDGANQNPRAEAPLLDFTGKTAYIDMTGAYPGLVSNWKRTVQQETRGMLVRDEIEAVRPVDGVWGMATEADIELHGANAILTKANRTLIAHIQSPANATFATASTQPPLPQKQNTGSRRLIVRLPGKVDKVDLRITLTPQ